MSKLFRKALIIAILFSFGGVFLFHFAPWFQSIKWRTYDFFERESLQYEDIRGDIIIIGVDKETLRYFGQQGSWSRSYYEWLLREIESHHPKAVALDYFFASKEHPEKVDWDVIEKLSGLSPEKVDTLFDDYHKTISGSGYISTIDTDFADIMKQYGNVVLPSRLKISQTGAIIGIDENQFDVYRSVATLGYANAFPDQDGIIRRFRPSIGNFDSFPMEIVKRAYPTLWNHIQSHSLINYNSRPYDRYKVVSFYKAYNGIWEDYNGQKIDPSGKIVLVADYDESLGDTYKTPVSDTNITPWIEIVANEIATILNASAVQEPNSSVSVLLLFSLTLFSLGIFFFLPTFFYRVIVFILLSLISFRTQSFLFQNGWYFGYLSILLAVFLPFFSISFYRAFLIYRDKIRIERIFSSHVDKSIVQELLSREVRPEELLEKREITVFFSDIEGFTSLSEKLDTKQLIGTLNSFFHIANGIIFKNKGTINKYIGDAVLAFWWAPIRHREHAIFACTAALEILEALRKRNKFIKTGEIVPQTRWEWIPSLSIIAEIPVNVRFGITTGEVIVGNIGDEAFSDYTIIGDAVNLASRLEGVNKLYHTNIILSEDTAEKVMKNFILRKIDRISVKGKNIATNIYELLDFMTPEKERQYQSLIVNHEKGLVAYFDRDWDEARSNFSKNYQKNDPVATVFLERIRLFEKTPPPADWDGVYHLVTK